MRLLLLHRNRDALQQWHRHTGLFPLDDVEYFLELVWRECGHGLPKFLFHLLEAGVQSRVVQLALLKLGRLCRRLEFGRTTMLLLTARARGRYGVFDAARGRER